MSDPEPSDFRPTAKAPSRILRRGLFLGALTLGGAVALGAGRWFNIGADLADDDLSAPDARTAALAGEILLIDIRRPDEWARTGIGEGAQPLDMRRADFALELARLAGAAPDRPLALICARGVRSARMAAQLEAAGFDAILDVPEGMLGSGAGPGWLARGLPVRQP
ncbi:MAG: rhodanese-like domain-containing protein [Sulfitobacter sp.]|nr:rhodanese-like domain-containing protein [Sulfitobacter sp.]